MMTRKSNDVSIIVREPRRRHEADGRRYAAHPTPLLHLLKQKTSRHAPQEIRFYRQDHLDRRALAWLRLGKCLLKEDVERLKSEFETVVKEPGPWTIQ